MLMFGVVQGKEGEMTGAPATAVDHPRADSGGYAEAWLHDCGHVQLSSSTIFIAPSYWHIAVPRVQCGIIALMFKTVIVMYPSRHRRCVVLIAACARPSSRWYQAIFLH